MSLSLIASRSSPSAAALKRKGRPPKKKSSNSSGRDEGDDLDYTGEESDQSFGEDEMDNLSDTDSLSRGKKRGRPKAGSASKDERPKSTPVASASPSLDIESDYDEIGETKVDRGGKLLGGKRAKEKKREQWDERGMLYQVGSTKCQRSNYPTEATCCTCFPRTRRRCWAFATVSYF